MTHFLKMTVAICFLILIPGLAWTQSAVEVTLLDLSNSQPIHNLRVWLKNDLSNVSLEKVSGPSGKVRFDGIRIAEGYYILTDESNDFWPAKSDLLNIRSNYTSSVILTIPRKKEYELETVEVAATSTTQINSVNAEVSSELQIEEVQQLPVEGRDITRSLYRLPNVSQATGFYPEAPNVSINGANSLFTNYMMDGMDNNERFLGGQKFAVPVGFTKNITILTNNYSAEYGWSGNGVVNITTPSGGNRISGEVFFVNRPGPSIDGDSQFAQRDLSGNQVKEGFKRFQGGFSVSGPLKQDQTFFYLNAEQTIDTKDNLLRVPQLGVNETVAGTNRFSYVSGKVDHIWNDDWRTSLRGNLGLVSIERQGGGLDGGVTFPSAGNTQNRNSFLLSAQNTWIQKWFTAEFNLQVSRFKWNYANPENTGPQVTVLDPSEATIAILGHPGFQFNETENTRQFQNKWTFLLDNHTVKAGLEWIVSDHELVGGGNPDGNYTVKLTQSQLNTLIQQNIGSDLTVNDIPANVQVLNYGVELSPAAFGAAQHLFSLYLEDQWAVNDRLNVTLGLRYEYDNLTKAGGKESDLDNFSPRLSANYRLDAKSSIRAGWGLFYDKIVYAIYSDALQFNTTSADYRSQIRHLITLGLLPSSTDINQITHDGNLTASVQGVTYLNGPSGSSLSGQRQTAFSNELRILNPNGLQNPSTRQFSLGYQYQLDRNQLFYADIVYNRSSHLLRLRNLNAPSSYPLNNPSAVVVRTSAEADLTRTIPIQSDQNGFFSVVSGDTLRGIARNIVMTESEGESEYRALSLNYQKARGDDRYAIRINYTLSRLENNTEDINFRAQDANRFEKEWGPSINDRTHMINGFMTLFPVEGLSLTLAGLLQSGQPINRIPDATLYGTTDLNGDGRSFSDAYQGNSDRHPGENRNNDRLPWSVTFDLGVTYTWSMGLGDFEVRADVFNLFNAQNLSGYSNNATQSNQIQVGSKAGGTLVRKNASAPRQFQFAVRYLF